MSERGDDGDGDADPDDARADAADRVAGFADDLGRAYRVGCSAVVDPPEGLTTAEAYDVQRAFVADRADEGSVVGYKLGFTNEAIRREVGVPDPVYGRLPAATVGDDPAVDLSGFVAPRAEPELVVRLGADLGPDATRADVADAVDAVVAAVEVVDTRTGSWSPEPAVAVADNALAARLVLGPERPLSAVEPFDALEVAIRTGDVERFGRGDAPLGGPLAAVAWLAGALPADLPADEPGLTAGTVVSTGSLTETVPLRPDTPVVAEFDRIGAVRVDPV